MQKAIVLWVVSSVQQHLSSEPRLEVARYVYTEFPGCLILTSQKSRSWTSWTIDAIFPPPRPYFHCIHELSAIIPSAPKIPSHLLLNPAQSKKSTGTIVVQMSPVVPEPGGPGKSLESRIIHKTCPCSQGFRACETDDGREPIRAPSSYYAISLPSTRHGSWKQ